MENGKWKMAALSIFFFLFSIGLSAYAQSPIIPCGTTPGNPCTEISQLFQLLVNIYNFLLGLAALVAMLMLVVGGVRMFLYYGADEEQLAGAKKTVTQAIIGLVIVAAAYLIVNTIVGWLGGDASQYFQGTFL